MKKNIFNNKKILIYGIGQRFYGSLFYHFLLPEIIVTAKEVCISDRDRGKGCNIGLPFIEKGIIIKQFEIIVITSDRFFNEIKDDLISNYCIDEDRILSIEEVERVFIREKLLVDLFSGLSGVEIGGPSALFESNIYEEVNACDGINFSKETVWWNDNGLGYIINGDCKGRVIISDAVNLVQINTNQYDFCISSNILEHIANPIKALFEMKRIIKEDGLLLTVVPNKDTCFDHNRVVTSFIHILNDYKLDVDETDMTHIDEIIQLHDYGMDKGINSREDFIERAKNNHTNRCLHQHVFDEDLLRNLYRYIGIEVLASGKIYSNWYVIGRKNS